MKAGLSGGRCEAVGTSVCEDDSGLQVTVTRTSGLGLNICIHADVRGAGGIRVLQGHGRITSVSSRASLFPGFVLQPIFPLCLGSPPKHRPAFWLLRTTRKSKSSLGAAKASGLDLDGPLDHMMSTGPVRLVQRTRVPSWTKSGGR